MYSAHEKTNACIKNNAIANMVNQNNQSEYAGNRIADNRSLTTSQENLIQQHKAGNCKRPEIKSSLNSSVAQCTLYNYKYKQGSWQNVLVENISELGYGNDVMSAYVQMLMNDTSAVVEGDNSHKKIAGLKNLIFEGELKDESVKAEILNSAVVVGRIDEIKGKWTEEITDTLKSDEDEYYDGEDDEYSPYDYLTDSGDRTLKKCINAVLDTSIDADTVNDLDWSDLPDTWNSDISAALYNQTVANYYDGNVTFTPYVHPYVSLISDINGGSVTDLNFVEKYRTHGGGHGAEFTVGAPGDLNTKYNNEAVVHTHYGAGPGQLPDYGHTKPYLRRTAGGYGHTGVTIGNLTGIADTNQTWNAL